MDNYFFGDISAALDLFVGLIPKYLDESEGTESGEIIR